MPSGSRQRTTERTRNGIRPLTGHLGDRKSPVRRFFEERLPNTLDVVADTNRRLGGAETIAPDGEIEASAIGTAFDYRARYYFRVTPYERLIAYAGADAVAIEPDDARAYLDAAGIDPDDEIPERAVPGLHPGVINIFFHNLDEELRLAKPVGRVLEHADEAELARYCMILAWFEQCARAGRSVFPRTPLAAAKYVALADEWLDLPTEAAVEDLCRLSAAFYAESGDLMHREPIFCNPTFPETRPFIKADADIVVDGLLVEFKCTLEAQIRSAFLWQLVGYVLLDQGDEYQIRRVAIYMARQRRWLRWSATELVEALSGGLASVRELRAEFARVLELLVS